MAELVARGLSKRRIDCLLLVSPNTLETHLRHIYAKLHIASRSDLAAYFAAHSPAPPNGGASGLG